MKWSFLLVSLMASAGLAGCATPMISQADASKMSNAELCNAYAAGQQVQGIQGPESPLNILIERHALTQREIKDIKNHYVRVGMHEYAAICAWGPVETTNSMGGIFGQHDQLVMGDFGPFVYADNGFVTAWQQAQ